MNTKQPLTNLDRYLAVLVSVIGKVVAETDSVSKTADCIVSACFRQLILPSDLEAAIERRRKP